MKLCREDQSPILLDLKKADSFIDRGIGLLRHSSLPEQEGLWIMATNSIHTFFMKFPIGCIFVDRQLRIKKIIKEIKPWRLILPVWGASSVIELSVKTLESAQLQVGDRLYVVD